MFGLFDEKEVLRILVLLIKSLQVSLTRSGHESMVRNSLSISFKLHKGIMDLCLNDHVLYFQRLIGKISAAPSGFSKNIKRLHLFSLNAILLLLPSYYSLEEEKIVLL